MTTDVDDHEEKRAALERAAQCGPRELRAAMELLAEGISSRPLAVLDALGFRELVNTKPLEDVFSRQQHLITNAYLSRGTYADIHPELMVFSDTIVIHPPSSIASAPFLLRLVEYLSVLISNSIKYLETNHSLPLRGGISFGEFVATPRFKYEPRIVEGSCLPIPEFPLLVGKAVVTAYDWERSQKWVGISIDPSSVDQLRNQHPESLAELRQRNDLVEWDVPTSQGLVRTLAVNFVCKGSAQEIMACLKQAEQNATDPDVKAKYLASRRFTESVAEREMFSLTSAPEQQDGKDSVN